MVNLDYMKKICSESVNVYFNLNDYPDIKTRLLNTKKEYPGLNKWDMLKIISVRLISRDYKIPLEDDEIDRILSEFDNNLQKMNMLLVHFYDQESSKHDKTII